MKTTPKKAKKFLVASGFMGECCTKVHTTVTIISAKTPEEAQEKLRSRMERKGFDCDETPVVVPASYLKRLA